MPWVPPSLPAPNKACIMVSSSDISRDGDTISEEGHLGRKLCGLKIRMSRNGFWAQSDPLVESYGGEKSWFLLVTFRERRCQNVGIREGGSQERIEISNRHCYVGLDRMRMRILPLFCSYSCECRLCFPGSEWCFRPINRAHRSPLSPPKVSLRHSPGHSPPAPAFHSLASCSPLCVRKPFQEGHGTGCPWRGHNLQEGGVHLRVEQPAKLHQLSDSFWTILVLLHKPPLTHHCLW